MRTYTVNVHEEEGGFWADVEELPGCFGSGDTLDELETDIKQAIESYVLSLVAAGESVPEGRKPTREGLRRWELSVAV